MGDGRDDDLLIRPRVRAFAVGIAASLDELADDSLTSADTTRRKVSSVVEACGSERRSERLLDELADALDAEGVIVQPAVNEPYLEWDAWLTSSRRPLPVLEDKELFPREHVLEQYLATNLPLIPELDWLRLVKTRYELPSGNRVDLLCEDPMSGDLVVVELKNSIPDRGVFVQAIEYAKELRQTAKADDRHVVVLIITGHPAYELQTMALSLATDEGIDLTWFVYDATLRLEAVASTNIQPPPPAPDPGPVLPAVDVAHEPPGPYDERHASPERPYRG